MLALRGPNSLWELNELDWTKRFVRKNWQSSFDCFFRFRSCGLIHFLRFWQLEFLFTTKVWIIFARFRISGNISFTCKCFSFKDWKKLLVWAWLGKTKLFPPRKVCNQENKSDKNNNWNGVPRSSTLETLNRTTEIPLQFYSHKYLITSS